MALRDAMAKNFLGRLSAIERYPDKIVAPTRSTTGGRPTTAPPADSSTAKSLAQEKWEASPMATLQMRFGTPVL